MSNKTAQYHDPFAIIIEQLAEEKQRSQQILEKLDRLEAQQSQDKMLTIAEACKVFSVTRQSLKNWVAAGYLQRHMIGTKPFFKKSELLEAGKTIQRYRKSVLPISK